ncbi:hypothetical protein [Anabaena sp. FACHB-1391]|uniref:hypothetical protein n=1 Tax=Anabaena sp. FACHB-1391 TaxID=2692771 RepID=UPI001F559B42|nr:hypothetical protein [Anabaena sp. FACHB-1391]
MIAFLIAIGIAPLPYHTRNQQRLIFLSRLNFLDLLLTNESQFLLPESVKEEISAKQDQSSRHIN